MTDLLHELGLYLHDGLPKGVHKGSDFFYKSGLTDPEYLRTVMNRKTCERLEEGVFRSRESPEVVFIKGGHFHAFGDEWELLKYGTFLKGLPHKKHIAKK